jgi:hypothetical protein|nr:MAG TPA: hypothetical protein [Caudoviricetes sp.]
MLNREKYAKEILDVVCSGHCFAKVDGKLQNVAEPIAMNAISVTASFVWRKQWNGRTVNMLSHLLIGVRLQ